MTIDDVIWVVKDETGREEATAGSKLTDLVADSLEFTGLIVRIESEFGVDISDLAFSRIEDVHDLYLAAQGRTEFKAAHAMLGLGQNK
jgi:acyl carrier protein